MWSTMLQMFEYTASEETACQLPGWTNVMTKFSPVPREEVLYRIEGTGNRKERPIWRP